MATIPVDHTSSTTMGSGFNQAVVNGIPNLWDDQLVFVEPESEQSSATFSEGRFSKQFDREGNPSETLLLSRQDRLENWHQLQELAGII